MPDGIVTFIIVLAAFIMVDAIQECQKATLRHDKANVQAKNDSTKNGSAVPGPPR